MEHSNKYMNKVGKVAMLRLSVIIPNYNNGYYIKQCVESIINQTYNVNEIIIVDDRSTDNSREIIQNLVYKYTCVKPIFLNENHGVSYARNIGLDAASSEYVTFIDADDFYFNREKLENEMKLIKHYAGLNKEILAYSVTANVSCDGELIAGILNRYWIKGEFIVGKALLQILSMKKQNRIPRDYCIKKSILQKAGAYSYYKDFYEDLDLLLRIAQNEIEFYCTYEYGTAYRKRNNGLSSKLRAEHKETKREIIMNYYSELSISDKIRVIVMKLSPFYRFV